MIEELNKIRALERSERKEDAIQLFLRDKMTPSQISEQLGIKKTTVMRYVAEVRKQWEKNSTHQLDKIRQREIAELDEMERQVAKKIMEHIDTIEPLAMKWFDRRLKVKERRAALLGLDQKKDMIGIKTNGDEVAIVLDRFV